MKTHALLLTKRARELIQKMDAEPLGETTMFRIRTPQEPSPIISVVPDPQLSGTPLYGICGMLMRDKNLIEESQWTREDLFNLFEEASKAFP